MKKDVVSGVVFYLLRMNWVINLLWVLFSEDAIQKIKEYLKMVIMCGSAIFVLFVVGIALLAIDMLAFDKAIIKTITRILGAFLFYEYVLWFDKYTL